MSSDYLESMKNIDNPYIYFPLLILVWILSFILYIFSKNIFYFFNGIGLTIVVLIGVFLRKFYRKKNKLK